MRPERALDVLRDWRLVPVVVLDEVRNAEPLCLALARGGMPWAEFTLRTPAGLAAIEIAGQLADFTVGAGTVLSAAQAEAAIRAGARFIVSPGMAGEVVRVCAAAEVPVFPGVATATEIIAALELGLTVLKFFPATQSGGPPAVRALADAFGEVTFMPTGGIRPETAADYLSIPAVAAIGGSWITPPAAVSAGRWSDIESLARTARTTTSAPLPA